MGDWQFEGNRKRRRREGRQFWAQGANSLLSLRLTLIPSAVKHGHSENFRPNLASSSSFVSHLFVLSVSFSFAPPLPFSNESSSSGAHHTTHSGKGLCIATGPGNISFRKITGLRRGCQCIKQTSLRQPYT